MTKNENILPENTGSTALRDDQLSEVSGGETVPIPVHPMGFKCCAAAPSHVYVEIHQACPICGCTEFTFER